MARHKNPQYNRKRLVVAGIAAVTTLGVAVGIGIYGSAFADQPNTRAANEQCLPTDDAPPPDQNGDQNQNGQNDGQDQNGQDGGQDQNDGQDQNGQDQNGGQGQDGQDQNTGQGDQNGDNANGQPADTKKGWLAGDEMLSLNGHPGNGTNQPDGRGDNGGDGADNGGNGDNGGNNQPPADYGGPKPPEQAPEPPADAPEDEWADGGEQCQDELGPFPDDFIDINKVEPNNLADSPEVQEGGSSGTFDVDCGTNENNHNNSANFIVAPGNENGAEHTHDYVGNEDTDGFTDNDSLKAAGTTCTNGDQSTYYWPVIRLRNEGSDAVDPLNAHNVGDLVRPVSAQLQFRGNAVDKVEAMPEFIRIITGDAKASTNGGANANAKWTCTGFEDRITTKYPLCPQGSNLVRISDFAGCWDGKNTDSANHRDHVAFADENGECQDGFEAIPQLRITLTYELPQGVLFALDAFPDEKHNPITDHADFVNVMSEELMDQAVDCINNGQNCK